MRAKLVNKQITRTFIALMLMYSIPLFSQNVGVQELQKFQQLMQDNGGQGQQQPMQQPEVSEGKEKMSMTEQEMMLLEEEEEVKRKKPTDLISRAEPKLLNNDIERFGYDLFNKSPTTYAPATDIPISPNYVIGPGDNIEIILFGKQADDFSLQVNREGEIYFPSIGPISVAGLTFVDMKKVLLQRINNQLIGVEASITLGLLKSIQVFVLGDAYQPGTYTISALSTLTNALFVSGGVKDQGSLRNIKLNRNGETLVEFDLYDLLLSGDTSKDMRLQSGDVIFIPTLKRSVGIDGEVRRPGIYELLENDTARNLIDYAGGLLPSAHKSSAQIERIHSSDGITLIDIDLNKQDFLNTRLNDGDIVYAYPISNSVQDVVLISGYFKRPGFYQWKENLKLSDLINASSDLLPSVDTNYVLIKREDPFNKRYSAFQVNLEQILINGDTEKDIKLESRDEIFFFSTEATELNEDSIESKKVLREKIVELEQEKLQLELRVVEATSNALQTSQARSKLSPEDEMLLKTGKRVQPKLTLLQDLIDEDLEMLVMKDNVVQIIRKDGLDAYEKLGFVEVDADEEMLEEIEDNIAILKGDRQKIITPFVKILERQGRPGSPAKLIRIDGSVLFPGEYPYTPNMSVEDAIFAAGGLMDNTYVNDIEVTKLNLTQKKFISSRRTISSSNLNSNLAPGDRILVKGALKIMRSVRIDGEVYFPGEYILSDNETLTELIKRAGGLTEEAFMPASFFQRESLRLAQLKRLKAARKSLQQELLFQSTRAGDVGASSVDVNEIMQLINMTDDEEEESAGRLVFDLANILGGTDDDLILENNDRIVIPKKPQSVSVIGEVYVPSSHIFQETNTLDDYIKLSGGAKPAAEEDAIYVIKADGSIVINSTGSRFFRAAANNIQPGDTIVIPFTTSTFSGLRATQDVTQILYQLAVAAAAISSFQN